MIKRMLVLSCLLCLVGVMPPASAQETSYDMRSGTVLAVSGNHLIVRGPDGIKSFVVPDGFVFNMNDEQLTIGDLRPGMPITAVIKTTSLPVEMTETTVKQGTVVHSIGSAFVVKTPDGQTRKFSAKEVEARNVVIVRDGEPISPYDLKTGDIVTATILTEMPPQVLTESELAVFVEQPFQPRPITTVAEGQPSPVTTVAAAQPRPVTTVAEARQPAPVLPKTASDLGWLAVVGLVALGLGAGLTLRRLLGS